VSPQLTVIEEQFEQARARLRALVSTTSSETLARRPMPASWSALECVAHLNLTSAAFIPLLRTAIDDAARLGAAAADRYRLDPAGWVVSVLAGPQLRIGPWRIGRVATTAPFVPGAELGAADVVATFEQLQDEQIALTRASDGRPIDRVKIPSPFDARVRYSAYSALVVLPRHQTRHLDQAEASVYRYSDISVYR
jgi:hypothetical protein